VLERHGLLLLLLLCTAWQAEAQVLPAQGRWAMTFEVYLGRTRGNSDNDAGYRGDRNGLLAGLLVGRRFHAAESGGMLLALDATMRAVNTTRTSDCLIAPDGGCIPWFPSFGGVSLLAGWESRSTNLRFLAGPGVISSDFNQTLGLAGRVDLAVPMVWRISAMANVNTTFVPSWDGDRFYYLGIGVGLRVR